jgi:uncharacterized protein YdhG (YjbR/CyaY superfamily)
MTAGRNDDQGRCLEDFAIGDYSDDMALACTAPATIDEYISAFPPEVQEILQRIRLILRRTAPDAQEVISYRIPAFRQGEVLVYFGAFKRHIGLYPPVRGDAGIAEAALPYAGENGNLRFPLDQPIPYALIERIARHRLKHCLAKVAAKRGNSRP